MTAEELRAAYEVALQAARDLGPWALVAGVVLVLGWRGKELMEGLAAIIAAFRRRGE